MPPSFIFPHVSHYLAGGLGNAYVFNGEIYYSERVPMGNCPDAYLAFGYDLGNAFADVKENNDYDLKLDWLGEDTYLDQDRAEDRLCEQLGDEPEVEIVTYGGSTDPTYVLVASASLYRTDWDASLLLEDIITRVQPKVMAAYAAQLQRGLKALGMTPDQEDPSWILMADYPE